MALGNTYQSNSNRMDDPTYYSRLHIQNPKTNTALNFSYWRGTLKISIVDVSQRNDLIYIHLSPTKAKIFAVAVRRIIDNPNGSNIFGIDTGSNETRKFIAIGRERKIPFLFIANVRPDGSYENSQRFTFNVDYNYLLNVTNLDNLQFDKEYLNQTELEQLENMLVDFARYASGACGASVYDIGRYESAKLSKMVKQMTGNNSESKATTQNNSFFNNGNDNVFSSSSSPKRGKSFSQINDLESELG